MDWTSIAVLAGTFGGTALLVFISYKYGRVSILKEQATKNAETKQKQLDSVVNRVDACERLSKHSF